MTAFGESTTDRTGRRPRGAFSYHAYRSQPEQRQPQMQGACHVKHDPLMPGAL
jgi:hypothetical protein